MGLLLRSCFWPAPPALSPGMGTARGQLDKGCSTCCQTHRAGATAQPPRGAACFPFAPCSRLSGGGQALVRCADLLRLSCPIFPACLPRHGSPMGFLLLLMFPYPPQTQPKAHFNQKKGRLSRYLIISLSVSPSLDDSFPQQQVSLWCLGSHPATLSQPLASLQEFRRSSACLLEELPCPAEFPSARPSRTP